MRQPCSRILLNTCFLLIFLNIACARLGLIQILIKRKYFCVYYYRFKEI